MVTFELLPKAHHALYGKSQALELKEQGKQNSLED
jgi:hypothetical protein